MTNNTSQARNIPTGDTPRPGVRRTRTSSPVPARRLPDSLREISWRLEPRDYVLAHLLHEHRCLTTAQISAVLFTSPRTCRNRLDTLRKIGFIDWFMPVRPGAGRLPVHWVPGPLSARYVALYHGERPPSPKTVREAQDARVSGGHLRHTDGANQFFVDLIAYSRAHPDTRLSRWWSAARIAAAINHNARPDGHGVWRAGGREVSFFLEHDTGTETLSTVASKLASYRKVRAGGGPAWPVLFWLPTTARETHLHQRLARATSGVIVATAARDAAEAGPAGHVWRLVGNGRRRLCLAELPSPSGAPGPYHPGPPSPQQDPLYLLLDTAD